MSKARSSREKSKHVNVFLFFFASSMANDIPFRYHVFALPWFHIIYIGRQKGMLTECKMLLLECISRQMHFISRRAELRKENHKPIQQQCFYEIDSRSEKFSVLLNSTEPICHILYFTDDFLVRFTVMYTYSHLRVRSSADCTSFKEQAKAVSDWNLSRPMWLIKRSGICVYSFCFENIYFRS